MRNAELHKRSFLCFSLRTPQSPLRIRLRCILLKLHFANFRAAEDNKKRGLF